MLPMSGGKISPPLFVEDVIVSQEYRCLPKFSLRTLVLLITLISIGIATTISASERVHFGLLIVSALLPPLAILLAIYLRGNRRAFWIGVAAFGVWSYVLMHRPSGVVAWIYHWSEPTIKNLVGDPIADLHWKRIEEEAFDDLNRSPAHAAWTMDQMKVQIPKRWNETVASKRNNLKDRPAYLAWDNLQIAVSLFGGFLACWLHQLRERRADPHTDKC